MNKGLLPGFAFVFFLSACTPPGNGSFAPMDIQNSTVYAQQALELTRENLVMQTIVALEQSTNTPTPEPASNLPKPWTDLSTKTATPTATPHSAVATGLNPRTAILFGPGYNSYLMACYIDSGTQLMIVGRSFDSSWLRVTFDQGQTCFRIDENYNRTEIVPEPTLQYWVFHSTISISGEISEVPIIDPTDATIPSP